MNYRNENSTPRDRYEGELFSENRRSYGISYSEGSCGCERNNRRIGTTERSSCRARQVQSRNEGRTCTQRTASCRSSRCGSDNGHLDRSAPIAMVYSPVQEWKELYDPETGLSNGTIFKELNLPFYPVGCRRKENSQCQCR